MKTFLLTTLMILTAGLLFAQPTPRWSSSISTNFSSYLKDTPRIKFDNSGDLVVVGGTNSASGGRDIILIKYSPAGGIIWQQTYNGAHNYDDVVSDFAIDAQNNILITGSSVVNSIDKDLIALKYDAQGNLKWVNNFDGSVSREDVGGAIVIDSTGASYIAGYTTANTSDHHKLLVSKVDSSGSTIWSYLYGVDTTADYHGEKIKIINNQIQVLGSFSEHSNLAIKFIVLKLDTNGVANYSNETWVNRPGSCFYQDDFGSSYIGYGIWEFFKIIKIDSLGNIAWSDVIETNLPSGNAGDEVYAIVVDSLQSVYITGRHYGAGYDILTVKYSPSGNRQWVKRYAYLGNNAVDMANDIVVDKNLTVYVAGHSQRTAPETDYDYVIIKYDHNGNEIKSIRYNDSSNGNDKITSIAVDSDSAIYVTGLTFENLTSNTTTQKYSSLDVVGVSELSQTVTLLNSFPNPFTSATTILFTNSNNELHYFQLCDLTGKVVFKQETINDRVEVSGENLQPGFYSFILSNGNHHYVGKIIRAE